LKTGRSYRHKLLVLFDENFEKCIFVKNAIKKREETILALVASHASRQQVLTEFSIFRILSRISVAPTEQRKQQKHTRKASIVVQHHPP